MLRCVNIRLSIVSQFALEASFDQKISAEEPHDSNKICETYEFDPLLGPIDYTNLQSDSKDPQTDENTISTQDYFKSASTSLLEIE